MARLLKQIRFVSYQAWKMQNIVVQKRSVVKTIRRGGGGGVCRSMGGGKENTRGAFAVDRWCRFCIGQGV